MRIAAFKAEDFHAMELQPAQAWVHAHVTPEQIKRVEGPNSWTGWVGDQVVWCFGWFEIYPTRAVVWALISAQAGPHFAAIHRFGRALVDSLPHKRLETEVDWDFEQGHRWMRMLGFELESPRRRAHRADGGDSAVYVRIR